jgi:hypothetical protein
MEHYHFGTLKGKVNSHRKSLISHLYLLITFKMGSFLCYQEQIANVLCGQEKEDLLENFVNLILGYGILKSNQNKTHLRLAQMQVILTCNQWSFQQCMDFIRINMSLEICLLIS